MEQHLTIAESMAEQAGARLLEAFRQEDPKARGTSKEVKSVFDEVADDIVKFTLANHFPQHSYLTEETGYVDNNSEYCWIIDPLDGTGNHANHNPFFSVSVSLWHNAQPVLGVIEAPALQERYIAISGKGAFIHDLRRGQQQQAHISPVSDVSQSYIVFCEGNEDNCDRLTKLISYAYRHGKDVRKLGSAALELAWVGCGRADGYFAPKISIWDIAAGVLFVHEANGSIMNFEQQELSWNTLYHQQECDLLATNGHIVSPIHDRT